MEMLFKYNWMVREEWYRWCEEVEEAELLKERTGGMGGILHTLFHNADVEWSWIRILQGKPDFMEKFESYNSLERVRELDASFRLEVQQFVEKWDNDMENKLLHLPEEDGSVTVLTWGEVMRHIIAHEIHHIGQLSVWSRELGRKPVSANLIWKGLGSHHSKK
ncbi:DinB family protein [Bacillus tianshenii]|nr:DinB family protein [Bacillus tianshenii]MCA1322409.1 DinB family protein [Bacillus tianshenii]